MLCWILEDDRSARIRLVKVRGDFVDIEGGTYGVRPDAVRLVRYPFGWPSWLQQIVPCSLYNKDGADPIGWNEQAPMSLSARELTAVLDPHWFSAIVKGTKEGGTAANIGGLRIVLLVVAGVSIFSMVVLFYLLSKVMSLEAIVRASGV